MSGLTPLLIGELFPNGIAHYTLGGLLIGPGTAVVYLGAGVITGTSTLLEPTLPYVSDFPRSSRAKYVASRDWQIVFALSTVAGTAPYVVLFGDGWWISDVQLWRFAAGGMLVGVGTRIGKGCAFGHGACGVGPRSRTSLVNAATFMLVATGVAQLLSVLGVPP